MRVLAVVKDLFFVARIRETARLVGAGVVFARDTGEIAREIERAAPALAILDLTTSGWDHAALLDALDSIPVLGFTTHALARQTQPLHGRCARVVTKETLTRELARILTEGIAA